MFDIPYIRLKFHLQLLEDTTLPVSKVSALRGGMGEMLLQHNCVQDRECDSCQFANDCVVWDTLYSRMDERPAYVTGKESVGYLIDCTDTRREYREGEELSFDLVLFGRSIPFFNIYLQAFAGLGMAGLGKEHSQFLVHSVKNDRGEVILQNGMIDMSNYRLQSLADYVKKRKRQLAGYDAGLQLSFASPLSMKFQGEYMHTFDGKAIMQGAMRRVQMMNYYAGNYTAMPDFEQFPEVEKQRVKRMETRRFSSTQNQRMQLPGIVGDVLLSNVTEEQLEYLIAAELLQIGKNTSFGFGKYKLSV